MVKTGKFGQIKVGNPDSAVLNESIGLIKIGDSNEYKMVLNDNEFISDSYNLEVFINDILVSEYSYSVNYLRGVVVFNDSIIIDELDSVTMDAFVYSVEVLGGFFEWSLNYATEFKETTSFDSEGFKEYTPVKKSGTVKANSYFELANLDKIEDNKKIILQLYRDKNTKEGRICFGILKDKVISVPVDGIIAEAIEFECTGVVYRI